MARFYKFVVFVPIAEAPRIREELGKLGAGRIGNYDFTSFSSRGIGRFRPLKGAKPAIGKVGKVEEVEEERIEAVVASSDLEYIFSKIQDIHPYEEPVIDIYPLENIEI